MKHQIQSFVVEVFKTNINDPTTAAKVIRLLQPLFPGCRINVDLKDCDRVLRIQGPTINTELVIATLQHYRYQCCPLED